MSKRWPKRFWACILPFSISLAFANDAEIVALLGKGDARNTVQEDWRPATVKQKVKAGGYVRTAESSQMALLLPDQTQVRLNQQSLLQIKGIVPVSETTKLSLERGRAWSQAKQGGGEPIKTAAVSVTTPAGTATVRGTDWELTVDDNGQTTLVVLSGAVDFGNEAGSVNVGPNEQAIAEPGKAPLKRTLSNAPDRIQWVTSWRPAPARWVPQPASSLQAALGLIDKGDYAGAIASLGPRAAAQADAALLLADLQLFLGRWNDAIALLEPHAAAGQAQVTALLARAHLLRGDIERAGRLVEPARRAHPDHVELLLAAGEIARLAGHADQARAAYEQVLRAAPKQAEAWFGLGRIETERENVDPARAALSTARLLAPAAEGYAAESGTLETFANNFAAAREAFDAGLAAHPDDYQAWTGLGILLLKTGQPETAREAFLKAGVIEPRFARAQLYIGIAYYQLGNRKRALESFRKAAELDPNDPVPHMMLGIVQGDALELGDSIRSAREAQERMPFLRSLNQVLNNQKGSANVGSSLSAFGLEEWARAYAVDSFNPYWAGSHLFLSDRYDGLYNKNSELFMGFLTDPTVFGASNRDSSLVAAPGYYGSVSLSVASGDLRQQALQGAVNGYSVAQIPFAYSAVVEKVRGHAADDTFRAAGENIILGLGARPTHELGVFLFANKSDIDGRFTDATSGLPADPVLQTYNRNDLGFAYRFSPGNQLWFKLGDGNQRSRLTGPMTDPALGAGLVNRWGGDTADQDLALRQTFDVDPALRLTWGAESARSQLDTVLDADFPGVTLVLDSDQKHRSTDFYLSGAWKPAAWAQVQGDLYRQNFDYRLTALSQVTGTADVRVTEKHDFSEWNPRLGTRFDLGDNRTLRLAHQRWRRPTAVSTLGPVDTAGIALDDRLPAVGGRLERTRLQYEQELGRTAFVQAYYDHERVKNIVSPNTVPLFNLTDLDSLRSNRQAFGKLVPYLEQTPVFGAGTVESVGLAGNWLVGRDVALALRYVRAASENTDNGFAGRDVPYIPRHFLGAALNWQPMGRWIVGIQAAYRSVRFTDEANTLKLDAGWGAGVRSYWESADKRWVVDAALENLQADKQAARDRRAVLRFNTTYRF